MQTIRCPAGLCWDAAAQACVTACGAAHPYCCAVEVMCLDRMAGRTCAAVCQNGLDPMYGAQHTTTYDP